MLSIRPQAKSRHDGSSGPHRSRLLVAFCMLQVADRRLICCVELGSATVVEPSTKADVVIAFGRNFTLPECLASTRRTLRFSMLAATKTTLSFHSGYRAG